MLHGLVLQRIDGEMLVELDQIVLIAAVALQIFQDLNFNLRTMVISLDRPDYLEMKEVI